MPSKINYIFHFDELTWTTNILEKSFVEIKIPYGYRPFYSRWLEEHVTTKVYIWPGVLTPNPAQSNWGNLISPTENTTFLIFDDEGDQTRFALEFMENIIKIYKTGLDAYYSRKR